MRKILAALSLIALLLVGPLLPRAASAAEPVVEKIKLLHADPNALIRLFSGGATKGMTEQEKAEAQRQSAVPKGIQGLLGYPLDNTVIVQGTPEAIEQLKRGIRVADVERTDLKNGRFQVVLAPDKKNVDRLDRAVRALPGAGIVEVKDGRLTLEGAEAWVEASLRAAIRVELTEEPVKP